MLPGAAIAAAENIARAVRRNEEPWGGLRIISVGDFAQLPPIARDGGAKDWAFTHEAWQASDFQPALLSTVMRTNDTEFLRILNFIRVGTVNQDVCDFLNARMDIADDLSDATRLFPHRAQAEKFNQFRLESIDGPATGFETTYEGEERYIDSAKKSIPLPDVLVLKRGALVMMRRNDPTPRLRYVNGSLAHRLPHNLNVAFPGAEPETLRMAIDDIAVSFGAACSTGTSEPSHVLTALGLPREVALSSVRFGLGRWTTKEEIDYTIDKMTRVVSESRRVELVR